MARQSRNRILAGVLAPCALGVAAVVAVTVSQPDGPTSADPALMASTGTCYDMVSVSLGGRGDAPHDESKRMVTPDGTVLPGVRSDEYSSHWVDPVVNAPRDVVGDESYAAVYVDYPAHMNSYEDAVDGGVENTAAIIRAIHESCPDTQFAIVGYSEGADVARRAAQEIGFQEPDADGNYDIVDPSSVAGVVILADAGRSSGDGPFPGAENEFSRPDGFDRKYQDGSVATPGSGALPGTSGGFGALDGKVASFCSEGDLTCSAPENIALLQLAVNVGRQLNIDSMQAHGLTPETALSTAEVLSGVALAALADISTQDDWMRSDETFLDVLIKVSDPAYVPNTDDAQTVAATDPTVVDRPIPANALANLAYLPEKLFKEVVGFIEDNENTLQVVLSDPYQQTLGPDTGHHFDYWRDEDPANGKELSSAEYAAQWLTHLAEQAKNGQTVPTDVDPSTARLVDAEDAATSDTSETPATSEATSTVVPDAIVSGGTSPDATVPGAVAGTPDPAVGDAGTDIAPTDTVPPPTDLPTPVPAEVPAEVPAGTAAQDPAATGSTSATEPGTDTASTGTPTGPAVPSSTTPTTTASVTAPQPAA